MIVVILLRIKKDMSYAEKQGLKEVLYQRKRG